MKSLARTDTYVIYASAVRRPHGCTPAARRQLGELDAARAAPRQLLAMKPSFAASVRDEFGKWHGPGELLEHFLDGLRKAGLEIPADEVSRS